MPSPTYELTLHKTYYEKGFFNLGVSVDKYVRPQSGEVKLLLGVSKRTLVGRVDREANQNGTPRIFGGPELRDWFFKNFKLKDHVRVTILTPNEIQLDPIASNHRTGVETQ
jgi:hypothetical protein